jgi:hypothetical protein
VNHALNGGERPTSVVTFGMNSVLPSGVYSAGGFGSEHGIAEGGFPCVRTGNLAAATAAGFVDVWSTIRLLMMRGCESKTKPFFCLYDELGCGGRAPPGEASASRKTG